MNYHIQQPAIHCRICAEGGDRYHRGKSAYTIYKFVASACCRFSASLLDCMTYYVIQSWQWPIPSIFLNMVAAAITSPLTTEWLYGRKTGPETISHAMTHSAQARARQLKLRKDLQTQRALISSLLRQNRLSGATAWRPGTAWTSYSSWYDLDVLDQCD